MRPTTNILAGGQTYTILPTAPQASTATSAAQENTQPTRRSLSPTIACWSVAHSQPNRCVARAT